ncbi:transcriptional regulator [bacterium M21]|nr:transcriptional regulator [bacterium M21]
MNINVPTKPILDPEFVPAVLWNRAYREKVAASKEGQPLIIALSRTNGTVSTMETEILPHDTKANKELNLRYVERLVKFLLWMKGGYEVTIAGCDALAEEIRGIYSENGARAFDAELMGHKVYGQLMTIVGAKLEDAPTSHEIDVALGGHKDGCRIGFDLGGSDRKCAAVIDGKVVFSEEIEWSPYFQEDPAWHKAGINDTLKRCAEHMPRVDSIGGSAAGVYVDNKVRVASLFRGVSDEDFKAHVRHMFLDLADEWKVPFVLVNDGEVTALAGAMAMNDSAVLGMSMGTSEAVGYVNPDGNITDWLNELAFAPVDYRDNAPIDEWSGDYGCGVQYFSQQGVARLAPLAGIDFPDEMAFPERLVEVQKLMADGDERARKIYETIGVYFAYTIAHYAEFYEIRNLLILGRVTSGEGGNLILSKAEEVLRSEFPKLAKQITFRTPDEQNKRHGQAAAAASLPALG